MNNERTLNNDTRIDGAIGVLKTIIDALEETKQGRDSMMACCKKRNLDGLKVRSIIESALKAKLGLKKIDFDIDMTGSYEKVYCKIFDLSESEFSKIELPSDYEESIDCVLNNLCEDERYVITKRFGLRGESEATLTDIASERNCSPESVRRIERKALINMRRGTNRHILKDGLAVYNAKMLAEKEKSSAIVESIRKQNEALVQEIKKDTETSIARIKNGDNIQVQIVRKCIETPLDALGFETRTYNCIYRDSFYSGLGKTLYDLLCYTDGHLREIRNLGKKSYESIAPVVETYINTNFSMSTDKLKEILFSSICEDENSIILTNIQRRKEICKGLKIQNIGISGPVKRNVIIKCGEPFDKLYDAVKIFPIENHIAKPYCRNKETAEKFRAVDKTISDAILRIFRVPVIKLKEMLENEGVSE